MSNSSNTPKDAFQPKRHHKDTENAWKLNPLSKLIEQEDKLRVKIKEKIEFIKPLVKHKDFDLFYPNSLNIIQGKMGSHKSRFSGDLASIIIANNEDLELSGMRLATSSEKLRAVYIDTERNLMDQFPHALQQIVIRGGYTLENPPSNLHFTSVIHIDRHERLNALERYIAYMQEQWDDHLVFILDVASDLQGDFNNLAQTFEFIDKLNQLINTYKITFFLVIHENPFNDKARGHTGTEGGNKASSLVSISKEEGTDLIKVDPLKIRNGPSNWYYLLTWDDENQGLVEPCSEEISRQRANKPSLDLTREEVLQICIEVLQEGDQPKGKLIKLIHEKLELQKREVSTKTIERRLEAPPEETVEVSGNHYRIQLEQKGRSKVYSVIKIDKI